MTDHPSIRRLVEMSVVGVVAGASTAFVASWEQAVLAGWIAGAAAYLLVAWRTIGRADGARTRELSTLEDDQRAVADVLLVVASVVSLGGAGLALHRANEAGGGEAVVLTLSAIGTVVASWLIVNTRYTLRYAHFYYTPPVGGVDFPGTDAPTYADFAYLAFTIGMTYQVSDTGLLLPRFRRSLLGHALLSYVFGAVIIAATINVTAGFIT